MGALFERSGPNVRHFPDAADYFTFRHGQALTMIRQFLQWFLRNRDTGAITIAQAPNLVLWVVIAAGVLLWVLPSSGNPSAALEIVFKGGLLVWAVDEVFRGVNPWRRFLGAAVFGYELTTIL
ncbi:MAG: hypothetical protein WDN50_08235 [Bradyrhizobium sp.]